MGGNRDLDMMDGGQRWMRSIFGGCIPSFSESRSKVLCPLYASLTKLELVQYCKQCENEFVGMGCGRFFFSSLGEGGEVAPFFCGMDSCRFLIIFFSSSKTPNVFGRKVGVSAISLPPTLCSSPSASASYERTNERTDFVRSNALTMFFELDVC